jgi:TPR repeat protein
MRALLGAAVVIGMVATVQLVPAAHSPTAKHPEIGTWKLNLAQAPSGSASSLQEMRAKAEQGDAEAQFDLGMSYFYGRGAKQDDREAARWIRRAADKGFPSAQYNLGLMYQDGRGVRRDDTEGARWLRLSADQGNASAQNSLGSIYTVGRGVRQDDAEAVRWFRRAADQGNAVAQFNLGLAYMQGRGVAGNAVEAVQWFRRAAIQGDGAAQEQLGVFYLAGLGGAAQDDGRAYLWFSLAAQALTNVGGARAAAAIQQLEATFTPAQLLEGRARIKACKESGFKSCGEPAP